MLTVTSWKKIKKFPWAFSEQHSRKMDKWTEGYFMEPSLHVSNKSYLQPKENLEIKGNHTKSITKTSRKQQNKIHENKLEKKHAQV